MRSSSAWIVRGLFAAVTATAILAACKTRTVPELTPEHPDAAPSPGDAGIAAIVDASDASRARVVQEVKPLTDEEKKKLTEYRAAMKAGRAAAARKDFKSAIASFDRALEANEGDGRALAARGEAQLMSTPPIYDRALADLEGAMHAVNDVALAAQIQLDLGLVYEGRKETLLAQTAFARSSALKPSRAASTKMAGSPRKCSASIDRTAVPGLQAPGWSALWTAIAEEYKKENPDAPAPAPPANDAEAKSALCERAACAAAGPWFVRIGGETRTKYYLVTTGAKTGDKLVAYGLDTSPATSVACGPQVERTVSSDRVLRVRVRRSNLTKTLVTMGDAGDAGTCGDEQSLDTCARTCAPSSWEEIDYIIDPLRKNRLLRVAEVGVEDAAGMHERHVTVQDNKASVEITGGGCDDRIVVNPPNALPK